MLKVGNVYIYFSPSADGQARSLGICRYRAGTKILARRKSQGTPMLAQGARCEVPGWLESISVA